MTEDNRFTPRIGRLRTRGDATSKRYLSRVRIAIEKAKPNALAGRSKHPFTGTRMGRGAGIGHRAAWRNAAFDRHRARRVVVKLRIAKIGAKGFPAARAHLAYVERDGVARDGTPGSVYDAERDHADRDAFLTRSENDRHQFRLIVAPEDADDLAGAGDLKGFAREFMSRMEKDLNTRLDWVAVDHFDTGHPHIHIVLRGRDGQGKDLVIARDYIAHGLRSRAGEIVQEWLGPKPNRDIAELQVREMKAERFTGLDRDLVSRAADGVVTLAAARGASARFQRTLLIGRLKTLERLGLATKEKGQVWRLHNDIEPTLRRLGERGDIIRTMQRALGPDREPGRFSIFEPASSQVVLGRVAATGAADETKGTRFVVIDGADARQWYAEIGRLDGEAVPPIGAIVRLDSARASARPADETIDLIARAHDGRYADAFHAARDPSASAEFRAAHVRRLEALRRAEIVTRHEDGSWSIPDDYLSRAARFEAGRAGIRLQVLSWLPLEDITSRRTLTWLDRELEAGRVGDESGMGFGGDLGAALTRRRAWLLAQGFAMEEAGVLRLDRAGLSRLARDEVHAAASRLSSLLGKTYQPAAEGGRVEGVYTRAVNLGSGRYTVLERTREFTLVPWRAVIEPRRGQAITGLIRGDSVQWDFGRTRGRGIS